MSQKSVRGEVSEILRKKNRELESELRKAEVRIKALENAVLKSNRRESAAEAQSEAFYGAIRVLAAHVSNSLSEPRKARETARQLVEDTGATPPGTLGSSRNRPKTKRQLTRSVVTGTTESDASQ